MKQKFMELNCTEKGQLQEDPGSLIYESSTFCERIGDDGAMLWCVYGKLSTQHFGLHVKKQTVRKEMLNVEELSLLSNDDLEHHKECQCFEEGDEVLPVGMTVSEVEQESEGGS